MIQAEQLHARILEELDMTSLEPGLKQLAAFIWNL